MNNIETCPLDVWWLATNRSIIGCNSISNFYGSMGPFKKDDEQYQAFHHQILFTIPNIWKCLVTTLALWLCPWVVFLARKIFTKEVLFKLAKKTKYLCLICLRKMFVSNDNFWFFYINGCPWHLCTSCLFYFYKLVA